MKTARYLARGLVLLTALLAPLASVLAQGIPGQVTTFTINAPDPTQSQTDPYRTSNSFVPITFSHNGATGSFFISTDGADIEGSTFQGTGGGGAGEVAAGFQTDGVKAIGLVLFQTRLNLTARTQQNVQIQYDSTPPTWQINTVTVDGGGTGGTGTGPAAQAFNAGTTYYTNTGSVTLQGTVADPDNGSAPNECTFDVSGLPTPLLNQAWGLPDGTFTGNLTLDGDDGLYTLSIRVADAFGGGNDDPNSKPNKGEPVLVKIVKDATPPTIERVEVIRSFGDAVNQQVFATGPRTFVGREQVTLRVTMSERMREAPRVSVTQATGVAIQAALLGNNTIDNRIFHYQYSVVATAGQNGPAAVSITGAWDGPQNLADFGYDYAYNPIAPGDPLGTIATAFVVDTISPDLIRYASPGPGNIVSVPRDGTKISRETFPDTIQVFVEDYDNANGTTYASGVDFSRISVGSAGASGTTTGLSITLLEPGGQVVSATPSIAPPNGIFLTLPDWRNPATGLAGFVDTDGDGEAEPREGTWTIRVDLVDKVGNTSTRTILFNVDNTPVNAADLIVNLTPPPPKGNPLPITGTCIGITQVTAGWPVIDVSSTDPTFSATRTNVEFYSQLEGPNAAMKKFDSDPLTRNGTTITMQNIRRPGLTVQNDDWPLPNNPVPATYVPFGSTDPRVGQFDGLYVIRVTPVDDAGNHGVRRNGIRYAYQDYEVSLDTTDPYVAWTFPPSNSAINEPLRFVDAVIADPAAPNGNKGCGIDVNATDLAFFLQNSYRPADFDSSYIETQNPGQQISSGRIRGTLRFIHNPNSTDPTVPSFNPNDDTYRVLLEIVDQNQIVRSLKEDGSMDGIYALAANPVDNAGNSLDVAVAGDSAPDPQSGQYYGLKSTTQTTRNRVTFVFLYDTIEPELSVSNFPDGSYIGGSSFSITGTTRDLSAKRDDPTKGGAGILKVEYKLEVVDKDGAPLPSEPARQVTTGNNQNAGVLYPAQNNPVIALRNASLSAIKSAANDPTRSTTRPMEASDFSNSQRELRTWTIAGTLPADDALLKPRQLRKAPLDPNPDTNAQDYYRLTIRSWDRAGNFTDVIRRVTVNLNYLQPPVLQEPACGAWVNRLVQLFRWTPVSGATSYSFKITYPDGNTMTKKVNGTEYQLTLSGDGTYRWQVASMDGAGNTGSYSTLCTLNMDRTAPTVSQFLITSRALTPQQTGKLFLGDFSVQVEFSEPLDLTKPISVSFDPLGAVGAPAQPVTTDTWTNTTTQSNWSGVGTIPSTAKPVDWDGSFAFAIRGATDRAGNAITEYFNSSFEIDTGPFFETKFFTSWLNPAEFTVVIVASEGLLQKPTLSEMLGCTWSGPLQELTAMLNTQKVYWATLKLQNAAVGNVSFSISGQDLSQNASKRAVAFKVSRPVNSGAGGSSLQAEGLSLEFPKGSILVEAPVYVFPPASSNEAAVAAAALGGGSAKAVSDEGELLDLVQVADLQAPGFKLAGAARIAVPVPTDGAVPAASPQIGIYGLVNGAWKFLGNEREGSDLVAPLTGFTQIKVAADLIGPRMEILGGGEDGTLSGCRPTVRVRITDGGSGVDPSSVALHVDGRLVKAVYDEATGEATWTPDRDLPSGTHALSVTAADQSGNAGLEVATSLLTPDGFGFDGAPVAYPNPCRSYARIRYALTDEGSTESVDLRVYDAAGSKVYSRTVYGPFSGSEDMDWDLTDRRGRIVANGVYIYKLKANRAGGSSDTATGKVAVLR